MTTDQRLGRIPLSVFASNALPLLLALLLTSAAALNAQADERVEDEIVVEVMPGVSGQVIADRYDLTILDSIEVWNLWHYRTQPDEDIDGLVETMNSDPDIDEAEAHEKLEVPEGVQRSIPDLGRTITSGEFRRQTAAAIVRTEQAQATARGTYVTVGIIDSGSNLNHPETRAQMLTGGGDFANGDGSVFPQRDFVDNDLDGTVDEAIEHGTFVAGLVNLAAPKSRIFHIRALDAEGYGSVFGVAKAILQGINRKVDVLNLSFSMAESSNVIKTAIDEALDSGIVVVASAGNRGLPALDFPASHEGVIAVAAVDNDLLRATFSNYSEQVDVSAPGVDLISTYQNSSFATWAGTSFSAPLATGAVALLLSRYPGLTPTEVRSLLRDTAQPDNDGGGEIGAGVIDLEAIATVETSDRTSLRLTNGPRGTTLHWSAVLDAQSYDLIRGEVANLHMDDDIVALGPVSCHSDDHADLNTNDSPDSELPAPGSAFFYVFRDDAPDSQDYGYGRTSSEDERTPDGGDCYDAR